MKNVLTILKKEFARFFKDRRMVISIFLPGIMIFLLYTIMGSVISEVNQTDENYKYTAYIENEVPQEFSVILGLLDLKEYDSLDAAKSDVSDGNLDLIIVFPDDFTDKIGTETPPDVRIYFNNAVDNSINGYNVVCSVLEAFKQPEFTVNQDGLGNLAEDKAVVGKILSMIMPMLMFSLLASGCIAVAPEAIAGEKERGTLATVLITPIKRWQLAFGKIISLACFATLAGYSFLSLRSKNEKWILFF